MLYHPNPVLLPDRSASELLQSFFSYMLGFLVLFLSVPRFRKERSVSFAGAFIRILCWIKHIGCNCKQQHSAAFGSAGYIYPSLVYNTLATFNCNYLYDLKLSWWLQQLLLSSETDVRGGSNHPMACGQNWVQANGVLLGEFVPLGSVSQLVCISTALSYGSLGIRTDWDWNPCPCWSFWGGA
jgi:hypothetical protein